MKAFQIKRASGEPMEWTAHGENAAAALDNWHHCFGPGFVLVDQPEGAAGRAVQ